MDKPLFYHLARSIAHAYLWMSSPFFGLFIYEWFVGRAELPFLGGILVVALAVLVVSLCPYRFYATQRVQEVFFYENFCRLRQEPRQRGTLLRNSRNISDRSSILCRWAWDSRQLQWGRRDPPYSIEPQESEFEDRPIFVAEAEGRHSTAA